MTRIAYISDLHLEEREDPSPLGVPDGMFPVYGSLSLPLVVEADVFVLAGDTHPDPAVRANVIACIKDQLEIPVIHVNGNHDYYGSHFPNDGGEVFTVNGVRFAVASLWTYLTGHAVKEATRFPDFNRIKGATIQRWNDLHLAHLSFLEQAKADVIVTHHAPFLGSVHKDFMGDVLNGFFVNNLDPNRFLKTRLWIHGQVPSGMWWTFERVA
ncbi:metallophosphoesterase [Microvirga arsenatis]|uniref:Calcineurin-like phosphoesterase domain-containing protein n=1 Tax=Microvirga arsenatis TaxID=2692265 RepID=A0ABW9Z8I2_9HYPH|nr:metallophosphoesterase [Microvirga arsenatis]NBJ13762.1 hypothetical protein [Microvirga arsenatis]NBJ27216.1 hypothetical protein [Microvirga arsenatis]